MKKHKSQKTFCQEYDILKEVKGVFWENEEEYQNTEPDPFRGIRNDRIMKDVLDARTVDPYYDTDEDDLYIPQTDYIIDDSGYRLYKASKESDEDFAEALHDIMGIDPSKLEDRHYRTKDLASFTAQLGMDAYGAYLPWHAFVNSRKTPWGIYIFFNTFLDWAISLFHARPDPRPSFLSDLRLVYQVIYRHELFHYHVERFSTRHEIMTQKPVYRPYVEQVKPVVTGTEHWLEEALAQAVVLNSTLVSNRSGKSISSLRDLLRPQFRNFPAGYRDFECLSYGGTDAAHRVFASQILSGKAQKNSFVSDLAIPKNEYSSPDADVPAYFAWQPHMFERIQFATPKDSKFWRFANKKGIQVVHKGPGDHITLEVDGTSFQFNAINGHVDKATIKKLAKKLNCSAYQLIKDINNS